MRLVLLPTLLLASGLWGCTQKYGYSTPTDTASDADSDADTDADTDTEPGSGDDQDGDGYTVEEGDCDDDDIWSSPSREEDPSDAKDNDCDGRVDEVWSGVTVAWYNSDDLNDASLVTLDSLGRKAAEIALNGESYPTFLDHGVDGGWVINDGFAAVTAVNDAGDLTVLADFSEDDFGVTGIATHPDGYYVATTVDDLWRIDPDGTLTPLATWSADFSDPAAFDLYGYTIAVDSASGEVAVFCQYGGFGVWNADTGFTIYRRPDIENRDGLFTYSGAHRDGGGWYSLSYESATYTIGVSKFSLADASWVPKVTWDAGDWFPNVLAFNGDNGDYYVTANGGWHYTVWRMLADGSWLSDFYDTYETDPTAQNRGFWGIVSNY